MYKQLIINVCKEYGLPLNQAAYILATTDHETNSTFEPVREAYWLSENWRKKNLRYYPWYGRGFVQLTWEENYIKAGEKLGIDLISNPDRAMDPSVAARILVVGMQEGWFTDRSLDDYIDELEETAKEDFLEYYNARRIVNGMDKANKIAVLAEKYEEELRDSGYMPQKSSQPATERGKGGGLVGILILSIFAAVAAFIAKVFGSKNEN